MCGPLPAGVTSRAYSIPTWRVSGHVRDGEILDLGGRKLEILHAPGHTPDSICLLDRANGLLFTGDTYYSGEIYLWAPETSVPDYTASIARLAGLAAGAEKAAAGARIAGRGTDSTGRTAGSASGDCGAQGACRACARRPPAFQVRTVLHPDARRSRVVGGADGVSRTFADLRQIRADLWWCQFTREWNVIRKFGPGAPTDLHRSMAEIANVDPVEPQHRPPRRKRAGRPAGRGCVNFLESAVPGKDGRERFPASR